MLDFYLSPHSSTYSDGMDQLWVSDNEVTFALDKLPLHRGIRKAKTNSIDKVISNI